MKFFTKTKKLVFAFLFGFSLFLLNSCETEKKEDSLLRFTGPPRVSSDSDCIKQSAKTICNTCTKHGYTWYCTELLCVTEKKEEPAYAWKHV